MSQFVMVEKASKPRRRNKRKETHSYKQMDALSKRMRGAVKADFVRGIETFKRKISQREMRSAWERGDYGGVMRIIPLKDMPDALSSMRTSLSSSMTQAGNSTIRALPPNVKSELRYDMKNPTLRSWINEGTGRLIQNVTDEVRGSVSKAVRRSFTNALKPRDVANEVKDSIRKIGLDDRRATALDNYRRGLMESGKTAPNRVDELVHKYSERLLDQRAMAIARTEVRAANNYAQLSVWQEAQTQGLLPAGAKKVYMVDGNPCEVCDPMDGQAVDLDDVFTTEDGDEYDSPPIHPHCYCSMTIEFGED